jgi:predicted MFS family arabinose efflux permease
MSTVIAPIGTITCERSGMTATRLALGPLSALGLGRFGYGLFVPAMAEQLHWSLADAGGLNVANGLGYLAGAAVAARVARRIGLTATFRTGLVLTAVALAALAVSGAYPALAGARAVGGFAGALVFVSGAALAADFARATASLTPVTIYFGGAGMGIALAGGVIPLLLDGHPERWPLGWWLLAVAAALAAAGGWRTAAPSQPRSPGTRDTASSVQSSRRRGVAPWPVATAYLLFGAGYLGYLTFLSAYLSAHRTPVAATCLTWVLLGLSSTTGPAAWSRAIARWRGTRALATLLAGVSLAAALPLLAHHPLLVAASALLFGATFMMIPAAVTAYVSARASTDTDTTRTLGFLTVLFAAGQTLGPWLCGLLADRTTPGAALAWTTALCAFAAAFATAPASNDRTRKHVNPDCIDSPVAGRDRSGPVP